MKIPKSFMLHGHKFTVEFMDDLNDEHQLIGSINHSSTTIKLQRSCKGYKMEQSKIEDTFIHEMVHAMMVQIGRNDLNNDEVFITQFSSLLHQAITSMEYDNK